MALETAFTNILKQLQQLHEAVTTLRLTVVEDKPVRADVALIDLRSDAIDDLMGRIDEATAAAARGEKSVKPPQRHEVSRQSLVNCQAAFNALVRRFRSDLVSYERMAELIELARERGREWYPWAASVRAALRQCEQPLLDVEEAMFDAWREVSARSGSSVSVRSTSIGQRVTLPTQ